MKHSEKRVLFQKKKNAQKQKGELLRRLLGNRTWRCDNNTQNENKSSNYGAVRDKNNQNQQLYAVIFMTTT